jgi:hypothetical protein
MKIEIRDGRVKTYDVKKILKSGCESGRFYFNPGGYYWWAMTDDDTKAARLCRFAYNLGLKVEIDGLVYMGAKKSEEKIVAYYNLKGSVMKRAWQIAKQAVAIYGGSSKQYIAESLRIAHAEARANHKRLTVSYDNGYVDPYEEDDRISLHDNDRWHQMG